jgi:hypothetical protein
MRNSVVQLPSDRPANQPRVAVRDAIRQLERADLYVAAVVHMDLGDGAAQSSLHQLRSDLYAIRRHLSEQRAPSRA